MMQGAIPTDVGHAIAAQVADQRAMLAAETQQRMTDSLGAIPEEPTQGDSGGNSINPKQAYDMYQHFTGSGATPGGASAGAAPAPAGPVSGAPAGATASGVGAAPTVAGGAGTAGAGAGTAGVGAAGAGTAGAGAGTAGAGAAGAGGGGAMAAAGPWVAAAAVVAGVGYAAHKLELPQKSIDLGKDMVEKPVDWAKKGGKAIEKGFKSILDIF